MTKVVGAVALGIALLTGISATADPDACKGAMLVFKSAKNGVGDYLRRYASCVSRSNGHDNCASEFSTPLGARRLRIGSVELRPRMPVNVAQF